MRVDENLPGLSLAEICEGCREQTALFHAQKAYDDRICFELFRRAVSGGGETYWEELQAVYRDLVLGWCRVPAPLGEETAELSALTWERFWLNYTLEKLSRATGTASALGYLKLCARSVAIDRSRSRQASLSLEAALIDPPDTAATPIELAVAGAARDELWQLVDANLRTEAEHVVVHLLYELDLRPADVAKRRPDIFPEPADVYRVTRNVLDRLGRDRRLRSWLREGGLT